MKDRPATDVLRRGSSIARLYHAAVTSTENINGEDMEGILSPRVPHYLFIDLHRSNGCALTHFPPRKQKKMKLGIYTL